MILPCNNEPLEGVIWCDIKIVDALHGSRAGLLLVSEEPFLDVLSFIAEAGGNGDRFFHELHGNGAQEIWWNIHLLMKTRMAL